MSVQIAWKLRVNGIVWQTSGISRQRNVHVHMDMNGTRFGDREEVAKKGGDG